MRCGGFVRRVALSASAAIAPRVTPMVPVAAPTQLLTESRRCFATQVLLCTAHPKTAEGSTAAGSSAADSGAAADAAASALDIAMRVNKLKRLHQTGGSANSGKKQLEFTAWKELNTLSEDQINHAEGKAVALLLNSWAYFAKFWEKGKDGPHGTSAGAGDHHEHQQSSNNSSNGAQV